MLTQVAFHLYLGYMVAYFSPGSAKRRSTWTIAATRVMGLNAFIKGLDGDSRYVFLVRAENSAGLSAPSGLSPEVRTPSLVSSSGYVGGSEQQQQQDSFATRKMLDKCATVKIVKAKAEGASVMRLTWEVRSHYTCTVKPQFTYTSVYSLSLYVLFFFFFFDALL